MTMIAYVDGVYAPFEQAVVHIEDRGYQFSDAVYEGFEINKGRIIDMPRHLKRLERSLRELRIAKPMTLKALGVVLRETVRRNRVDRGFLYLQVTRGVAPRNHVFPGPEVRPVVTVTARKMSAAGNDAIGAKGVKVITTPDIRWGRPDIKSTSLLPNVLARQEAAESNGAEAWLVDDEGMITEGAASNAWIVSRAGELITRSADNGILRGITRAVVMDIAASHDLKVIERSFSVAEAKDASEAFMTAASNQVVPIIQIDDTFIGDGKPGKTALELRRRFHDFVQITP